MRKDAHKQNNVHIAQIQGYHQDGGYQSYAFAGFEANKYFTSDRFIRLDDQFRRPDGKPLQGFGLEIETECWGIRDKTVLADVMHKIIFDKFPADLFKMQADGSLGDDNAYDDDEANYIGVECITQVMTKAFIRNHYKDFKTMFNVYFPNFRINCADTGHCGMHVNISNAVFGKSEASQKEAIRKLHYFINHNFETACKLLKRNPHRTHFCGRMQHDKDYCKTMEISGGDHYVCMNYSHFDVGRIELRLVGGQPDYYAFRNTMELIFFLCERMTKISWADLDDMTKVFTGCNQYVYKRLREILPTEQLEAIRATMVTEDYEVNVA